MKRVFENCLVILMFAALIPFMIVAFVLDSFWHWLDIEAPSLSSWIDAKVERILDWFES